MNKLVSKNPILRFKLGKKIIFALNGTYVPVVIDGTTFKYNPANGTYSGMLKPGQNISYLDIVNAYNNLYGKQQSNNKQAVPVLKKTVTVNLRKTNSFRNNATKTLSTYKTPELTGSKELYLNRLKQLGFTAKPTIQNTSLNQTMKTTTPVTKRTNTPKQPSIFMGVKAGGWNKSMGNIVNLTLDLMNLLNSAGIKYGNALELLQGLNKYLFSKGINGTILEDNKWGNQSKKALDFVLNRLNLDRTRRFDNNAPKQVIQAISPVLSLTTFPTTDFKPQIQNVRNNSYNRADIRSLINQAGFNAYDFSGALRKALRKYLNGESNDTTLLDGTDLARFTLPYRKQGGLISRNPILRFKLKNK